MQATTIEIERNVPVTTYEVQPVPVLVPDFTDRVRRGAELLDDVRERLALQGHDDLENWRSAIDTSGLDLASGRSCVLGQVFVDNVVNGATAIFGENYDGGVNFLFPRSSYAHLTDKKPWQHQQDAARAHGFLITDEDVEEWDDLIGCDNPYVDGEWELRAAGRGENYLYEVLTEQWVNYLNDTTPEPVEDEDDAADYEPEADSYSNPLCKYGMEGCDCSTYDD
jgi:hypothetical protein